MAQLDGRTLGVWSLRLDAIYCTLLGAVVALGAAPIATVVMLPQPVILLAGITVVTWAGLVLWMLARLSIRIALRTVMGVNLLAAVLVGLCSAAAGPVLAAIGVLAIAIDVLLFAVSQALALHRLPTAQIS
ncbi:hypothetical protein L2X99_03380 [Microbacterium sp. KUDC0406]|uniref:hypothetical protein n=1 Tax=Microbacterium sp. KUDC0406 TaxID=2909588 RepID=UPI001F295694|nr:hypothetical protein [Microbacterium sp. KUDC0406]UJP10715.1 hypothetical protein L2X99_03380 [Microbacterium sp. KUDC0406]